MTTEAALPGYRTVGAFGREEYPPGPGSTSTAYGTGGIIGLE